MPVITLEGPYRDLCVGRGYAGLREGLGDIYCAPEDCSKAASAVTDLAAVFARAGRPERYTAAYDAITNDYLNLKPEIDALSPWWPAGSALTVCCRVREVGQRARALTLRIAADAGFEPPPDPFAEAVSLLRVALWIAVAGVAIWAGVKVYGAVQETRRSRKASLGGSGRRRRAGRR